MIKKKRLHLEPFLFWGMEREPFRADTGEWGNDGESHIIWNILIYTRYYVTVYVMIDVTYLVI